MTWSFYIIPLFITTLTGWLVVFAGTRLIFHPKKPLHILGLKLQGVFPAKQSMLAEKLGSLVGNELFSFSEMEAKVLNPDNFLQLKPEIEQHIDFFLREKLKTTFPMLSAFIGDKTIHQLKAAFLEELKSLFPVLMKSYMGRLQEGMNLELTVADKIKNFPADRLEAIVNSVAKKQFRKLEFLGAAFGFLMGVIQVLLMVAAG